MNNDLKRRIDAMRARLDGRAPVAEIHASSQLFVTPDPVCRRLVALAGVTDADHILEPEAGTGAILRAIREAAPLARCDAVELNGELFQALRRAFPDVRVINADFLQYQSDIRYSKILMNPPFQHAADIQHIRRALALLDTGGVLAAICLNGPRQEKALRPLAASWEVLARGTFAYTDVSTVMLTVRR